MNIFSFTDLIILQTYLGIPVYAAGVFILIIILKKYFASGIKNIVIAAIAYLITGIFFGLVIWIFWPFYNLDMMLLEIINLPAIIATLILLPLHIWIFSLINKKVIKTSPESEIKNLKS
jgi:hypothetical protein